jgi:hypothetical protein
MMKMHMDKTISYNGRKGEWKMISWYWLIIAFVGGSFLGMAFLGACVAAGQADHSAKEALSLKDAHLPYG